MVADCAMGILSDSIPPVVAATDLRCGIFFIGMATASAEGKFKVAYPFHSYRFPFGSDSGSLLNLT